MKGNGKESERKKGKQRDGSSARRGERLSRSSAKKSEGEKKKTESQEKKLAFSLTFFNRLLSGRANSPLAGETSRSFAVSEHTMTTDAPVTSWAQRAAAAATAGTAAAAPGNASSPAADASTPAAAADANAAKQTFDSRRYVVLDTNALLVSGNGGAGLSRYAKSDSGDDAPAVLVTTKAALAEVRDAASRQALERTRGTGVCELSLREPEEEDVKAGKRLRVG